MGMIGIVFRTCLSQSASLFARFRSRREHTFADKLLSAMRAQFGGHAEAKIEKS